MTNEVVRGVAKAIVAGYPTIPVYTEKVDQGIEEPSFVVRCYRNKHNLYRGRRYFKEHRIEVQYFPPKENCRQNAHSIEEGLFRLLQWITVGEEQAKIMGKNMETYLDEQSFTVIFTVMYNYYVLSEEDAEKMESMSGDINLEDGYTNIGEQPEEEVITDEEGGMSDEEI